MKPEEKKFVCSGCKNDKVEPSLQIRKDGRPDLCFDCAYDPNYSAFVKNLDPDLQKVMITMGMANVNPTNYLLVQVIRELKKMNRWAFKSLIVNPPQRKV